VTLADVSGNQVDRTRTAADGSYRLHPRSGGTFLLIAAEAELAPRAAMVAVGDAAVHHDLVLAGNASLRGHVRVKGGTGLAGAMVTLTDVQGEVVGTAVTGPDGGYALADLLPGTYTLVGRSAGRRPVASTVDVGEGATVERDILLPAGVRVAGTVRADSDARPLPEAHVTLLDEDGNVLGSRRTGPDGGYAFDDLPEGSYTVIASGYAPVATGLTVTSGRDVELHVVLGAPT
jgi:uncharacterized surface anchored protein